MKDSRLKLLTALTYLLLASPVLCDVAIVDGDTFDLDGVRIRLNGIDAPEY